MMIICDLILILSELWTPACEGLSFDDKRLQFWNLQI